MQLCVAFESSRASFPLAAECRVEWVDMHYLITCLLCTLLPARPDLILAHNTHLPVLARRKKWGQISDAFIHEIFINCQLKTCQLGENKVVGVRNVALDTQWLESLVGASR